MKFFLIFQTTIIIFFSLSCKDKKLYLKDNSNNTVHLVSGYELEYYPHYETIYLTTGKGYEFTNPDSKKILITLDGGPSWETQIGKKDKKIEGWRLIDRLLFLYTVHDYNIFVPEIFDWEEDESNYYWNSIEERERNTFDNVQVCYFEVIKEYLSLNEYEDIVIIGFSSGARHLPMIYLKLEGSNVTALISIACGGLAPYEKYDIMLTKQQEGKPPYEDKEYWENLLAGRNLKALLDYYNGDIRNDSTDRFWGRDNVTYRWINSILDKRPFDYYENINIPVLFIHGELDSNVPVESTKYVEENLPNKPFDYIYYQDMSHGPSTPEQLYRLQNAINDWLIEKGF